VLHPEGDGHSPRVGQQLFAILSDEDGQISVGLQAHAGS
jgi:hypothetical protein